MVMSAVLNQKISAREGEINGTGIHTWRRIMTMIYRMIMIPRLVFHICSMTIVLFASDAKQNNARLLLVGTDLGDFPTCYAYWQVVIH